MADGAAPTHRKSQLESLLDDAKRRCARLAQRESQLSWSRLATFLGAFALLWLLQPYVMAALLAWAGALAVFVFVVRAHLTARREWEHSSRMITVIEESLRRVDGVVTLTRDRMRPQDDPLDRFLPVVLDHGATWPLTAQERDDLDFYSAPVGVFGLLNRTSTALGARRLRERMENIVLDGDIVGQTQAAVRWLHEHREARYQLLARLASLRREDARLGRLISAVEHFQKTPLSAPAWLLRVWSIFTCAVAVVALSAAFGGAWQWNYVFGAIVVVNGAIVAPLWKRLAAALAPWRDVAWVTRGLATVVAAADTLPDEGRLGVIRAAMLPAASSSALPVLAGRVGWADTGGLVHTVLNVIAFLDLHTVRAIEHIVAPRKTQLLAAISAVADLEVMLSLACFADEQAIVCYPEIVRGREVEIRDGAHPLVSPTRVVTNDARLTADRRVQIITGSNMAGKSTFLRMIGLNVIFAQIGGAACARQMRLSPLRLLTDLRATDNLAENESYFLSEVRHLRRMVRPPDGPTPLLGLIDEPFRGTNSIEQTAASVGVVRHLIACGEFFLVATHDRHLTLEADGVAASNLHFRENLDEHGALVFDYKIRAGPATTRNALRVLEREGYPTTIVDAANDWVRNNAEA